LWCTAKTTINLTQILAHSSCGAEERRKAPQ
jgi:hypothetical protein